MTDRTPYGRVRWRLVLFGCALTLLAGGGVARADPIVITGGFMQLFDESTPGSPGTASLVGDTRGFTFEGTTDFIVPSDLTFFQSFSGSDLGGTVTLDGNTYSIGPVTAPAAMILTVRESQPVTLPDPAPFPVVWRTPFRLDGSVSTTPSGGNPGTFVTLTGFGTATMQLRPLPFPETPWIMASLRYDFAPEAPAPVPEPATVTLTALGIGTLVTMRRRRTV